MTAEICREPIVRQADRNPGASIASTKLAACSPVHRLSVVPGPSEAADLLPPSLQADPVGLLAYRVQIFNSTGHSTGNSATAAYAAAGLAPSPVDSLQATASEQGAILEWKSAAAENSAPDVIDFQRIDLSTPPRPEKKTSQPSGRNAGKSKSAHPTKTEDKTSNETRLRAPDTASASKPDTAGTVDATAAIGDTYIYTAQRIRAVTIDNHTLEIASQLSSPVTLAMRDSFPPKPPIGLATISGTAAPDPAIADAKPQLYIDLSWEPNGEPDLAGYRVYRQLARPDGSPQGPLARLTALPIAVPAYRDVAVKPGQGYIYTVTALDAAGNESAPSAKALESVSQ